MRWKDDPIHLPPQLYQLLRILLTTRRWPVSFEQVTSLFERSKNRPKWITNAISDLNNQLTAIGRPGQYHVEEDQITIE